MTLQEGPSICSEPQNLYLILSNLANYLLLEILTWVLDTSPHASCVARSLGETIFQCLNWLSDELAHTQTQTHTHLQKSASKCPWQRELKNKLILVQRNLKSSIVFHRMCFSWIFWRPLIYTDLKIRGAKIKFKFTSVFYKSHKYMPISCIEWTVRLTLWNLCQPWWLRCGTSVLGTLNAHGIVKIPRNCRYQGAWSRLVDPERSRLISIPPSLF